MCNKMDIDKKMLKVCRESKEYLESISALEFMEDAGLFARDLRRLIDNQRLPATVLIGCLMHEVYGLDASVDDMLVRGRIIESFEAFKKYVDEKFIKKEKL